MHTIIPYQDRIFTGCGAMISPGGNIQSIYTLHEVFARNYCNGEDYDYLKFIKYNASLELFEEFKRNYYFNGNKSDIDEWCHSKLTPLELEKYKIFLNQYGNYFKYASALDYMIYVLKFDKVESLLNRTIITTSKIPHIRFFNYYLMDWDIRTLSFAHFNKEKGKFYFNDNDIVDLYHSYSIDSEAEEEINNIKKKTKKIDIPYFFR